MGCIWWYPFSFLVVGQTEETKQEVDKEEKENIDELEKPTAGMIYIILAIILVTMGNFGKVESLEILFSKLTVKENYDDHDIATDILGEYFQVIGQFQ